MKRNYNRAGNTPTCMVLPRGINKRIGVEHVMTMWYLYSLDGMTYQEIAEMYGISEGAVCKRLLPISRHVNLDGDDNDAQTSHRALKYHEALQLLHVRRRMRYRDIARMTGLNGTTVRRIAERNKLER